MKCDNCIYFNLRWRQNTDGINSGTCHYNPPENARDNPSKSAFPKVKVDDFCRKYESVKKQPEPTGVRAIQLEDNPWKDSAVYV